MQQPSVERGYVNNRIPEKLYLCSPFYGVSFVQKDRKQSLYALSYPQIIFLCNILEVQRLFQTVSVENEYHGPNGQL